MDSVLSVDLKREAEAVLAALQSTDQCVVQKWLGYMEGYLDGKQAQEKEAS